MARGAQVARLAHVGDTLQWTIRGTDKLMEVERQSLDENIQVAVQTPPISAGDHSTRGLALLSLQL